jgi:hypothetical protein
VGTQNDPPQWTDVIVMNYRVSPPGTAKGRRAWIYLSLLLPALASKVSTQATSSPSPLGENSYPPIPQEGSQPYLTAIGPPPLRFEDVFPPPDLSTYQPAGAPPKPADKAKNSASADKDVILPKPVATVTVVAIKATESHPAPAAPTPPAILADDVPVAVRPEDFLPYFQYPGAGPRGRAETPPAPPLPVSTATYTQSQ